MKLGCHAVMFGPELAEAPEKVFSRLRQTGFQGAEVGIRFLQAPGAFERVVSAAGDNGMEISGLHHGGALAQFADDPEGAKEIILAGAELAARLPNKNVVMSGMPFASIESREPDARLKDAGFVEKMALGMDECAKAAAAMGVMLCYHNHNWEFENGALIFNAILKLASNTKMGMDTGWAYKSGYDPIRLIRDNPGRFGYLHIRDYNDELDDFVNLGEGDMKLGELLSAAEKELGGEGWVVVEYETGPKNYKRYVTAKIYLDHIMKA